MGEFKWNPSQVTLLLVKKPTGTILAHVSYTRGNEEQEKEARDQITKTRDRWHTNAPHMCGTSLEIEELKRPTIPRVPHVKRTPPDERPLDQAQ